MDIKKVLLMGGLLFTSLDSSIPKDMPGLEGLLDKQLKKELVKPKIEKQLNVISNVNSLGEFRKLKDEMWAHQVNKMRYLENHMQSLTNVDTIVKYVRSLPSDGIWGKMGADMNSMYLTKFNGSRLVEGYGIIEGNCFMVDVKPKSFFYGFYNDRKTEILYQNISNNVSVVLRQVKDGINYTFSNGKNTASISTDNEAVMAEVLGDIFLNSDRTLDAFYFIRDVKRDKEKLYLEKFKKMVK